jgi:hypothetical protein
MRDTHRNPVSTRKSKHYFIDLIDQDDAQLRTYVADHTHKWAGSLGFMINEDAHQLLPHRDEGYTVRISSDDPRTQELVTNSLAPGFGSGGRLEDRLRHCVEQLAQQVLAGGTVFEIDYLTRPVDDNRVGAGPIEQGGQVQSGGEQLNETPYAAFEIGWIPSGTVAKRGRRYIQYVPTDMSPRTARSGLHFVELDRRDLVFINLSGRQKTALRRARGAVAAAAEQDATSYNFIKTAEGAFDQAQFRAQLAKLVMRGTRELGWDSRFLYNDYMLDTYTLWRHLQFERFKVDLRDAVLTGINEMLYRAGQKMNFSAVVEISGAVTAEDLDNAEAQLASGSRPLVELFRIKA